MSADDMHGSLHQAWKLKLVWLSQYRSLDIVLVKGAHPRHANKLGVSNTERRGIMLSACQSPDGSHGLPPAHLFLHSDRRLECRILSDQSQAAGDDDVQGRGILALPAPRSGVWQLLLRL